MARLVTPSKRYWNSYRRALAGFHAEKRFLRQDTPRLLKDPAGYLRALRDEARGVHLPPGWVPATTYWLVEEGTFIGRVTIRHRLNAYLRDEGGHIGYAVRASKRRKGYGTQLLRRALAKAAAMGLKRVLVTCDDTNVGSRKIIEANGGVLENRKRAASGVLKRRYWIRIHAKTRK
ncbi:MAG: GNAT family N-acetyltransferase [Patescibacteria group bacterium]|nr:GNAT family N-acetyltransferase [Patescibacteria group bacterium]MDE1965701.1 GNAT family N-acetyltransferase [Patescibacteria group bacterium]